MYKKNCGKIIISFDAIYLSNKFRFTCKSRFTCTRLTTAGFRDRAMGTFTT